LALLRAFVVNPALAGPFGDQLFRVQAFQPIGGEGANPPAGNPRRRMAPGAAGFDRVAMKQTGQPRQIAVADQRILGQMQGLELMAFSGREKPIGFEGEMPAMIG